MILRFISLLRERMPLVIRCCYGALGLLLLSDALFVDKSPAHTGVERLPGFWSLFGFIACVLIILVSKWYGHQGIMTREDYYDQ